jgi:hypothetical protein
MKGQLALIFGADALDHAGINAQRLPWQLLGSGLLNQVQDQEGAVSRRANPIQRRLSWRMCIVAVKLRCGGTTLGNTFVPSAKGKAPYALITK